MSPNKDQQALLTDLLGDIPTWNRFRADHPDWVPNLKGVTVPMDLADVDSSTVRGLTVGQLAGRDLTRAELPANFDFGLANVEQAARNARGLFVSMLLLCLYAWLTIGTTTDIDLLTGGGATKLPFVGAEVPVLGFFLGGRCSWAACSFGSTSTLSNFGCSCRGYRPFFRMST